MSPIYKKYDFYTNRNDTIVDLGLQTLFSNFFQLAEEHGSDLLWSEAVLLVLVVHPDSHFAVGIAFHAKVQKLLLVLQDGVANFSAHQPLEAVDWVLQVGDDLVLGGDTQDPVLGAERHAWPAFWQCYDSISI